MHIRICLLACAALATPAHAQKKAAFLDGTYTMSVEACGKLQAIAKGGHKSIGTVPWSVSRDGIDYWEGGCGYTRITEQLKGRKWLVVAACHDGPDASKETYTWIQNANGTFSVTLKGEKTAKLYTRCDVSKGK
jgi:hypothetical protein